MSVRAPFPVRRPRPVTATGLIDFFIDGVYPLQGAHLRRRGGRTCRALRRGRAGRQCSRSTEPAG
ncbi:hypothetical protein ACFWC5_30410 [Streptomyces sp. NPDC060085]|uniref:hypothetical protein n=1 Tax=Streptomyces sp. NPDC060085 TaxID=3347054 RepID=UPI0036643735